jgi:glycosyltransferase involved in cell wall biosynthesis
MADLYVMPSVSEPFGITALEAMMNNTPIIVSKQSGVSEVISHCFKVDFWDIDKMADRIIGILQYPELHETLQHNGAEDVTRLSWKDSARKCIEVYAKAGVYHG